MAVYANIYLLSMVRRLLIILLLSLGLGLMGGEVISSETTKTEPPPSKQRVPKTDWRSIFTWLATPRDWFSSGNANGKVTKPGLMRGKPDDQAVAPNTQRHLLPLERQGRDENDAFKTFLFVRPKFGLSDIGTPESLQDQAIPSTTDGCAAYANGTSASDDKKLSTLTDLSLGICMRF